MKKSIILALALVAPAFGKGVETVVPVTVVETTTTADWAVEAGPTYHWALNDMTEYVEGADMIGGDVTLLYNITDCLAATLRFGWSSGTTDLCYDEDYTWDDLDAEYMSVTAGLRYTMEVAPGTRWYIGAEAGVGSLKLEYWGYELDDKTGFAYGIETGVQYDVAEGVYVYGAVEFSGCTADPCGIKDQFGYGLRAGVGVAF